MAGIERKIGKGISFTPSLLSVAETRAKEAGFRSISEYIADLIERDLAAPRDSVQPRADTVANNDHEIALLSLFRSAMRNPGYPLGELRVAEDQASYAAGPDPTKVKPKKP